MRRFCLLVFAQLVGWVLFVATANADTHVPWGFYFTNTTWTLAGSPYVIDGDLHVTAGTTLTIEPGVVVKMNGTFRQIYMEGLLIARGTAESPIIFTSIQDDSVAGDSGGDGPSVGAPGQWYNVEFSSATGTSYLDYVTVRYGGWGSANWNYGAFMVRNGATLSVDHSTFTNNDRSGILIGTGATSGPWPSATVEHSTFTGNGNGISVNQGLLQLRKNSQITGNRDVGVWINLASSYDGAASTIMNNTISNNTNFGVRYQGNPWLQRWTSRADGKLQQHLRQRPKADLELGVRPHAELDKQLLGPRYLVLGEPGEMPRGIPIVADSRRAGARRRSSGWSDQLDVHAGLRPRSYLQLRPRRCLGLAVRALAAR